MREEIHMALHPFERFSHVSLPSRTPFVREERAFDPRHFALGVTTGAGIAYFLDPDRGKRRRIIARDRFMAIMRRLGRRLGRRGRKLTSDVEGRWQHLSHDFATQEEPSQWGVSTSTEQNRDTEGQVFDFQERRAA
jgi:hypothetical protein